MRLNKRIGVAAAALASILAFGCNPSDRSTDVGAGRGGVLVNVPSGSQLDVRLKQSLSSETAHRGDRWAGVVMNPVVIDGREVIPSGATVEGVVVAAEEARRGSRARLQLGVRGVLLGDRKTTLHASSEPVIAGSPRARNLGAIAGGAAAGALIGKATGDNAGKGALIGGAVATGVVAASKGYQVVLKDGTVMTFIVNQDVAVRVG
jgi:hypothetical protein